MKLPRMNDGSVDRWGIGLLLGIISVGIFFAGFVLGESIETRPVNVNTATLAELTRVMHEDHAVDVLEYRRNVGGYRSLDQLVEAGLTQTHVKRLGSRLSLIGR